MSRHLLDILIPLLPANVKCTFVAFIAILTLIPNLRVGHRWKPPKGGGRTFPTFTRSLFAAQWATDSCRGGRQWLQSPRCSEVFSPPSFSIPFALSLSQLLQFCTLLPAQPNSGTGTVGGGIGGGNGNEFCIVFYHGIVIRLHIGRSLIQLLIFYQIITL